MEQKGFSGNPLLAAVIHVQDLTKSVAARPGDVTEVHALRQAIEKTEHLARVRSDWAVARYAQRCGAWALHDPRDPATMHRLGKMVSQLRVLANQADAAESAMRASQSLRVPTPETVSGLQHGIL